ncbi:hypothetical protein QM646_00860 [Rhodococcus erythropolis]|nr:hypothetical protein [Rhodococcus erythropolis]
MSLSDLTRESVLEAMREFDDIGREEFLKLYGFDEARGFTLVHDGSHYDSKAIASVAHRHSVGEILKASSFSGGRSQTVPALIRLGFRIIDTGSRQQRAWLVASKQTYRRLAGGDTYDDHVATHTAGTAMWPIRGRSMPATL